MINAKDTLLYPILIAALEGSSVPVVFNTEETRELEGYTNYQGPIAWK